MESQSVDIYGWGFPPTLLSGFKSCLQQEAPPTAALKAERRDSAWGINCITAFMQTLQAGAVMWPSITGSGMLGLGMGMHLLYRHGWEHKRRKTIISKRGWRLGCRGWFGDRDWFDWSWFEIKWFWDRIKYCGSCSTQKHHSYFPTLFKAVWKRRLVVTGLHTDFAGNNISKKKIDNH